MPNSVRDGQVPLVIGVTGHRDITTSDEAPLRAAFASVLSNLSAAQPHTPLLVLSGLAAGADILAAEEAIARGIPVFACLPMPIVEYENDFTPAELTRFRSALAACARVIVTSPIRENGYVATALFLAHYSHLLVAFWDGDTSRGKGGTADVVHMRMTGEWRGPEDIASVPYLPDAGPVCQIVTPRLSGARPADGFAARFLYHRRFRRDINVERDFRDILDRMDVYNRDIAQPMTAPNEATLESVLERTDAAANRLQKRTRFFQMLLYIFATIAAALYITTHSDAVNIVGLFVALFVYWLARKNNYQNRYQDYRAIAEGLRVQRAWRYAGLLHKSVDAYYLRMQESELQWIRMELRCLYLLYGEGLEFAGASAEHPVCRDWIRAQWRYYYRTSRRNLICKRRLTIISTIAIVIGGFIGVATGALLWLSPHRWTPPPIRLLTEPFVLAVMLSVVLAHYAEKQDLEPNARRYERMFYVFDRARRRLLDITKRQTGDAGEVIFELGREALIEHADWLIARRVRPLSVPRM